MWPVVVSHDVVVLQRRDVVGALHVTADEVTACGFVEWSVPAGEKPGVADQVLDHRLAVRPVDLRFRHEAAEIVGWRWEIPVNGNRRRGADEHE